MSAGLSRRGWVPAVAEAHVQAIARQVAQQSRQVSVPRPEATLAALATAVAGR